MIVKLTDTTNLGETVTIIYERNKTKGKLKIQT